MRRSITIAGLICGELLQRSRRAKQKIGIRRMIPISIDLLVQNLPTIMLYIVPGFLSIMVFNFFTATKSDGLFLWVESAAISFVGLSVFQILTKGHCAEWVLCFGSCVVCVGFAIPAALVFRTEWFKDFCGKYFRITNASSVLSDAVNWQKGTTVLIRLKESKEIYAGQIRAMSQPGDCRQWISIDNPVQLNENYQMIWPADAVDTQYYRMAFHLEDIDFIQFI